METAPLIKAKSKRHSFPKNARLLKRGEFTRLQSQGEKLYSRHFVILYSRRSASGESRIGVTVSRKVDLRAVTRNRIRRLVREVFRLNRQGLSAAFDILVIARKNAAECAYRDAEREILGALRFGRLLRGK